MRNLAMLFGLVGATSTFGSDQPIWSVDANLRLAWVQNGFSTQDEDFYAKVPLVIRDEKGKSERLKVSIDPSGLELVVLAALDPSLRVGAGIGYLHAESYASNGAPDAQAKPFLEQFDASLRGRWLPWTASMKSGGSIGMEVDFGLGGTMGTLQRFGLAAAQIASKPDSVSPAVREVFAKGSPESDLWGVRTDLQTSVARQWESGARLGAGVGFTAQLLWLDRDPLAGSDLQGLTFSDQSIEYGLVFKLFAGWAF